MMIPIKGTIYALIALRHSSSYANVFYYTSRKNSLILLDVSNLLATFVSV